MKVKIRKNLIKYCSISILLLGVLSIGAVYAYSIATGGYRAVVGVEETVDKWTVCKKVTNNNTNDIFIPTGSDDEWRTFRDNVAGVTFAECCTDDTECASRSNGETWCPNTSTRAICSIGSDSCLNYSTSYCSYGCSNGNCQSCVVTDTCDSQYCSLGKIMCKDNCGDNTGIVQEDCTLLTGTGSWIGAGDGWCGGIFYAYCLTSGLFGDGYHFHENYFEYDGTCSGTTCDRGVTDSRESTKTCALNRHVVSTPMGCTCLSPAPVCNCTNDCTLGQTMCEPWSMPDYHAEYICGENDTDLCLDWVRDNNCGTPTYTSNYCLNGDVYRDHTGQCVGNGCGTVVELVQDCTSTQICSDGACLDSVTTNTSCYKTYCTGFNNKVLFTPEYPENHGFPAGASYYATCKVSWTADMRDSGWGSTCSTGWQDIQMFVAY